jgi:hypothetical protein
MRRFGDFRQRHDIGTAAHHGGKIVHTVLLERVDANRDHRPRLAPFRKKLARDRPRGRPKCGRRKVLKLLDRDIGAA